MKFSNFAGYYVPNVCGNFFRRIVRPWFPSCIEYFVQKLNYGFFILYKSKIQALTKNFKTYNAITPNITFQRPQLWALQTFRCHPPKDFGFKNEKFNRPSKKTREEKRTAMGFVQAVVHLSLILLLLVPPQFWISRNRISEQSP